MNQVGHSKELAYGAKKFIYPTFTFLKLNPDSNANTQTISASGGANTSFTLPVQTCFSFPKSIMSFTSTPAGGTHFNMQWIHTVPFFSRVTITTSTGRILMDRDSINFALVLELPMRTPITRLLNNSLVSAASVEVWQGLRITNGLTSSVAVNSYGLHSDGVAITKNYTEKCELVGGADTTATPVLSWSFPLTVFGDLLADERILAFNDQITLNFQMAPVAQTYYNITALADPTTGAAAGTSMVLSNILIQLAVVQDKEIVKTVLQSIQSKSGLNLLISYTNTVRLATSGTTQSFSNTITRQNGPRLKSISFSAFATDGGANMVYSRTNVGKTRPSQAQTFLNSVPLQTYPMVTASNDDYNNMVPILADSSTQSLTEYRQDWWFADTFYNKYKELGYGMGVENPQNLVGIEIISNIMYNITLTTTGTNQFYIFQTFQRHLNISIDGTFLDGN